MCYLTTADYTIIDETLEDETLYQNAQLDDNTDL
jgi:hypothetical protein